MPVCDKAYSCLVTSLVRLEMSVTVDETIKVLIGGDSGVGKTCMVNCCHSNEQPNKGIEFKTKILDLDGKKFKLQVWDLPGQERYRAHLRGNYYNANGFVIMFDVTNEESFDNVTKWHRDFDEARKNAVKILVGNKCDLFEKRMVDFVKAKRFADELGIPYLETSVNDEKGFDEIMMTILMEKKKKEEKEMKASEAPRPRWNCQCWQQ